MLDELRNAELRVMRYLPGNLEAPEIASELCVSANTVRTHLRHIYTMLDSHDRNQAFVRAASWVFLLLRRALADQGTTCHSCRPKS